MKWPAERIELIDLNSLKSYDKNPRTHSQEQVQQVARSISEFGWTMPVLIDESHNIIAGHCRVMAAKLLGISEVPTVCANGWTEAQRRAYLIADNQLTMLGGWDDELLRGELVALRDADYDLSLTGFNDADLLKSLPVTAEADDIPQVEKVPVTHRGDLWNLGAHRLICGDSTLQETVRILAAGAKTDLVLTDPPYCSGGFQEAGKSGGSVGTDAPHKQIANDRLSTRGFQQLLKAGISSFDAPFLYAFTDWRMWIWLFDVAESSGYGVRSMIVWDKGTPGMGRGWRAQHELILWGSKSTPPFALEYGGSGNVLQCSRTGNTHHTTEKPVEIIAKLLEIAGFAEIVADPFIGSGSTLIACEQMKRKCLGVELDPLYCDVCIRRWQNFTGKAALLNDRSFDEVAADRMKEAA